MYDNKRLILSIFWIVLGVVLMVLTMNGTLDHSVYSAMGGAFIAVGVIQVIKQVKYRTNSEYKEKIDTEVNDERNRFIRMKSWSWAGYITIFVEFVGIIIAMIAKEYTIQTILSYSVCLIIIVYLISYLILNRKY